MIALRRRLSIGDGDDLALLLLLLLLCIGVVCLHDHCHMIVLRCHALRDNGDDVLLLCIGGVDPVRCAAVSLFGYQ